MPLIWRCATKAVKDSLSRRAPIQELLRKTGSGWEIPLGIEPPKDMTAKELAEWVREKARPIGKAVEE